MEVPDVHEEDMRKTMSIVSLKKKKNLGLEGKGMGAKIPGCVNPEAKKKGSSLKKDAKINAPPKKEPY